MKFPSALLLVWVALVSPAHGHDEQKSRVYLGALPAADQVDIEQKLDAQVPLELKFVDERGAAVTLSRYFESKPVLLALVYYNCERLCPLVLEGLARSLRPVNLTAGDDYHVVAVSIDPAEGPALASEKKRVITGRYSGPGGERGWHLLTGAPPSIDVLTRAIGFRYARNENAGPEDRFVHAAATVVVTPTGKISRYFYGIDYPPRDLRFALIEASGNRIGSAVDKLLLLCYAYDPAQGKYTLSILRVLQVSGTATVLALGGFLVVMVRRERKSANADHLSARTKR